MTFVGGSLMSSPGAFGQSNRIEGEDFTAGNGVRTENTSDTGGGLNLCHIDDGEWAEYTVTVSQAGSYEFDFRVASNSTGGTIGVESNGSTIGSVAFAHTGGWQSWTTVSSIVTFAQPGTQTIRLNFAGEPDSSLFNINWLTFQPAPIFVEAENFTSQSGVRTEDTADAGGGTNLGYIENGDWAEYSVTIPEAGEYQLQFRAASNNDDGGSINIVSDGTSIGDITVPDTNSWQNWITISTTVNFNSPGNKTLRLNFSGGDGSLFNLNWFRIQVPEVLETLPLTIGSTLQQKMRYGMDYERLWYWTGGLNGSERDEVARWSVVDADVDFVRVAMNSGYELEFEGDYDLSAYSNKIIPLMQEMQQANPNIKFFASPRPLNEAYPNKKWEGSNVRWQPYPFWICGAPTPISGDFDFDWEKCSEYLVRYLLLMKSYGFKISFMDVTNEWQSNGGGGRLTQGDMDNIENYLSVTYFENPWSSSAPGIDPALVLEPADIPQLIAPSSWNYQQGTSWINNLEPGEANALSIAASHNTDRGGSAQAFAAAARSKMGNDVEVWNTETHGWKSTSGENETTSFYYYLEAIRAGFGGINGWLAIGTTSQGHSYILNPGGTPRRNVKYYIYRKLSSTSNYGNALNILEEPEEGVLNAPLGSNDDNVPRNVAAFIKDNLMTVWVVNENNTPVSLEITPAGRTIAASMVRRTHWTDPNNAEGFVTSEQVSSPSSFTSTIPGESVSCFEIVLDGEDFSNDLIQAEDFTHQWGTFLEDQTSYVNLAGVSNGDFTRYGAIALAKNSRMSFSVARPGNRPDGFIEIRDGSADGPLLGRVAVPETGNWQRYETIETTLDVEAGIYNLYLGYAEDTTTTGAAFFNMDWFTVNDPSPLSAPTGLTATATSSDGISLSWNASEGATSYNLLRATSASGPFVELATGLTTTTTNDPSASVGVTYYYVARAVNAELESANSLIASGTISLSPPSEISATAAGISVDLSWSASPGASSYKVFRSISLRRTFTEIMSGVTTTQISDTPDPAGTNYFYFVRAVNAAGESSNSATVLASLTLSAPAGLAAAHVNSSQIDLSWNTVSDATGYHIKRSLTSGGPYDTIASGVTSRTYSDTAALTPGTRYYYVVAADFSGTESEASNESSAVPSDPVIPEDVVVASMNLGYDLAGSEQVSASIAKSGLGQFYRVMASSDMTDAASWTQVSPVFSGNGGNLDIEFDFDYSAHEKYFFRLEAWTE